MKAHTLLAVLGTFLCNSGSKKPWGTLAAPSPFDSNAGREKISINDDWKFKRYPVNPDGIIYDHRPDLQNLTDVTVLRPWILPTGNDYIVNPKDRHPQPTSPPPKEDVPFIQKSFNDLFWETIKLPHDWGVKGPFYTDESPPVGGGMGRLPVQGVGWYRKSLHVSNEDKGKTIYLDIDGAMSYAMVWLNGRLVGGWPYGYNSFRLDLTPFLRYGKDNQLAIRLDNPLDSARWYPGAGLYRNVWLTKVNSIHVGYQGTYVTTTKVSTDEATMDLNITLINRSSKKQSLKVKTEVFHRSRTGGVGDKTGKTKVKSTTILPMKQTGLAVALQIPHPRLWGPPPTQKPNLYIAMTQLIVNEKVVDSYVTEFGIRTLEFKPDKGFFINGEHIKIQGVNEHHDLGSLGAAFSTRAAERKLEILRDLGVNSLRMSHNPPATEFLQLTDRMGFLVVDEIFDSWQRNKTSGDFHLIFDDWHEQDARSFVRRDRNHASIIAWSFGNEVGEQYTDKEGAALGKHLSNIIASEDPTRPTTASMNYAKPNMPFGGSMDLLSINYQGSRIRDTSNYSNQQGIRTHPLYPEFHEAFPDKVIIGSETASTLSTRGTFIFPVDAGNTGAPVNDTSGGNSTLGYVSAYELYTANFGSPPDKVWVNDDKNPYVAGEFVWTGFDYIGEPTPYYSARSSYCGIVDLAGFKKDRYYLYQSRWRPEVRTAHILPHWNWPDRRGKITPVHVFSPADEAELFLNGKSQGKRVRGDFEYRFRWDDVVYQPGELRVKTWKDGKTWATETIRTTGKASKLKLTVDRPKIDNGGEDLAFITAEVLDKDGRVVPTAANSVSFSLKGPGEIVSTDNGDPTDLTVFQSPTRKALSGLVLAIVRGDKGGRGVLELEAKSDGLESATVRVYIG
ncbi:Beta-galactosidase BoGH2A [Fusarium venenatum]|uniref:Beta-galactosidase n=1 Tax=Fusarium venenatum TaxID=56646 RepID=A0A2L2TU38_9HYPO|nr:uncharacterized protein FVRRES_00197 [Fusarium venenatum]KAG8355236.1 Beta-galactosidase BoGH2A [Fusarium venenatum]CEI63685.1 unnamed protein product [Fusarium venenatum]